MVSTWLRITSSKLTHRLFRGHPLSYSRITCISAFEHVRPSPHDPATKPHDLHGPTWTNIAQRLASVSRSLTLRVSCYHEERMRHSLRGDNTSKGRQHGYWPRFSMFILSTLSISRRILWWRRSLLVWFFFSLCSWWLFDIVAKKYNKISLLTYWLLNTAVLSSDFLPPFLSKWLSILSSILDICTFCHYCIRCSK